ncbi:MULTISPECIES: hypothetical protein [Cyanophyceae]|uniref:hypothetical protein n=1 Tax=Cyanophyceae TaxID=3028117 RepID=UPI0016898221|nr:hypothetical protein [Trichocoleus sp. FACHB-69]MBD1935626.1 hypothetical protein [Trichocoleus sp. FACHB-69]
MSHARAVTANVAVVEAPAAVNEATEMEVNETVDDAGVVSYSAAATVVVNEQVSESEEMPRHGVSDEQLAAMRRMSKMVSELKKERGARKVNAEIVGAEVEQVREKTYFERINEWIKSGDNGLINEAMKWAMNQDNIEFEHFWMKGR